MYATAERQHQPIHSAGHAIEVSVVDFAPVELPGELAQQRLPLLVPRLRARHFALDDAHRREPRVGGALLLPRAVAAGCRAPSRDAPSLLQLDRGAAPAANDGPVTSRAGDQ